MGMGHVQRSIALAEELRSSADICFLTNNDETVVGQVARAQFTGFPLTGEDEITDWLRSTKPDTVIIDRLDVPEQFAREMKHDLHLRIVIFGNLSAANRYADVVVNAAIGTGLKNSRSWNATTRTLYLSGPRYLVLRREFTESADQRKTPGSRVDRILLLFGGSDPSSLTSAVLDQLLRLQEDFTIDVILGARFVYFDQLNEVLEQHRARARCVTVHRDIGNVAELMRAVDLVITSPGLSLFEALRVGTPAIAIGQSSLQQSWFEGGLPILERAEIGILGSRISQRTFLDPDSVFVRELHIGEGRMEVVEAALGGN